MHCGEMILLWGRFGRMSLLTWVQGLDTPSLFTRSRDVCFVLGVRVLVRIWRHRCFRLLHVPSSWRLAHLQSFLGLPLPSPPRGAMHCKALFHSVSFRLIPA